MEDIWSIILSFIPFKSVYEYKTICRDWNILLTSYSFWKSYCKNKCIKSDKNWENDARYAWVHMLDHNRKKFIPTKAIEKYQQGMNYYDLLNYEQASQFYKEAMDLYPNYSDAIIKLAECYRIMGMCKEAEELCNQVCVES
jgi:tetratricopeptide (TPR) repeat protein